jgi:hypothetical protein
MEQLEVQLVQEKLQIKVRNSDGSFETKTVQDLNQLQSLGYQPNNGWTEIWKYILECWGNY